MDLIAFSKNVVHDDFVQNIRKYFDENIAMYNIIDRYNIGVDVSAHVDATSIVYVVKTEEMCDTDHILDMLANATISLYGHQYNIIISQNSCKKMLSITLRDRASRLI